jgi:hypothetical protein
MRAAILAVALTVPTVLHAGDSDQDSPSAGWWIVTGSFANDGAARNDALIRRSSEAARRCGLTTFNDFSFKFRGLKPGYDVVVIGPYPERASARRYLARVQPCVPGAYLKEAEHLGE